MPDNAYHYGDPASFTKVKGYEEHARMLADTSDVRTPHSPGVAPSDKLREINPLVGTPDQIVKSVERMQELTGAREIVAAFNFAGMRHEDSARSIRLFANEVLPAIQEMPTPIRHIAERS